MKYNMVYLLSEVRKVCVQDKDLRNKSLDPKKGPLWKMPLIFLLLCNFTLVYLLILNMPLFVAQLSHALSVFITNITNKI